MKHIHRILAMIAIAFMLTLAGCAAGGMGAAVSPEAQIAQGANALAATTTIATLALKHEKITVAQAKSYRVMLGAASSALDDANSILVACRKATGSTALAANDPCRPQVVDIIVLALNSIAEVKRTLDAK